MTEKEALDLLKKEVKTPNLIKHSLAVGACMEALGDYFGKDKEKWKIAGLLHDIDYEKTKNDPQKHSLIGAEMLEKIGLEKEIVEAIKAHNEIHGIQPKTKMAKALFSVDPLTGLIVASALVMPDKKLTSLKTPNVLNRFKEEAFAKGANREAIKRCQELDLSLERFVEISLLAMKSIAAELGL